MSCYSLTTRPVCKLESWQQNVKLLGVQNLEIYSEIRVADDRWKTMHGNYLSVTHYLARLHCAAHQLAS